MTGDPAAFHPDWLRPAFAGARVRALMTSRAGGVSAAPFGALNLRDEVGDDPAAVAANRARVHRAIGRPSWLLRQVHGIEVCDLDRLDPAAPGRPQADACVTTRTDRACEIQVADCLPVLFADRRGRAVAAAHAGWRGLAGGVLEATLAAVVARAGCAADEVECWLGPCIGPTRFEVGDDVVAAFGGPGAAGGRAFVPVAAHPGKWLADLPALARARLAGQGVTSAGGHDPHDPGWCTRSRPDRWFSYRHAPRTGRMAALIWLDDAR